VDIQQLEDLGFNAPQIAVLEELSNNQVNELKIEGLLDQAKDDSYTKEEVYNALLKMIVQFNTEKLAKEHRQRVKDGGFSIQSVDGPVSFSYSVGLAEQLGYELILRARTSAQTLGIILNTVARKLLADAVVTVNNGHFDLNEFTVDERPLRLKMVQCLDTNFILTNYALMATNPKFVDTPPESFRQIFICDANHLLPEEEGYNEAVGQDLTQSVDDVLAMAAPADAQQTN